MPYIYILIDCYKISFSYSMHHHEVSKDYITILVFWLFENNADSKQEL